MTPLDNKISALQQFQDELNKRVLDAVRIVEAEILDMNTDEQLFKGIDAIGNQITPEYSPFTVQIKRFKGQPTNRVTLKDTGDFYRSFYIEYSNTDFEIKAKDEKTDKLGRKYGYQIFGLTPQNVQEIIELIHPEMIEDLRKTIDV